MALIETQIRWADNTAELAANLKSGLDQIEAVKTSADRLTTSLGGQGLFKAANNLTAAISQLKDANGNLVGAIGLTDSEQARASATLDKAIAKYQALGQQAPTAMRQLADELRPQPDLLDNILGKLGPIAAGFGLAFGATAIISGIENFGAGILSDAMALERMSGQTGISTEALQRLRGIGDETGNTLDQMTMAVSRFQRNLEQGTAAKYLNDIGISIDDIKSKAPDQQFLMIGQALEGIQDPAVRANVAIGLFGRTGAELLPALLQASEAVKNGVSTMSDQDVKDLAAVEAGWNRLWQTVKTVTAHVIAAPFVNAAMTPSTAIPGQTLDAAGMAALNAPTLAQNAAGQALTLTDTQLASAEKVLNDEVSISIDKNKAAAAATKLADDATKKFQASVSSLVSSSIGAVQGFGAYSELLPDLSSRTTTFEENLNELGTAADTFHGAIGGVGTELTFTIPQFSALPNVVAGGTKALQDAAVATVSLSAALKGSLTATLESFPDLLAKAFEGGGGLSGALKALGAKLGKDFGDSLTASIKQSVDNGGAGLTGTGLAAAGGLGAVAGVGAMASGQSAGSALGGVADTAIAGGISAVASGATIASAVALGAATLGIGAAAIGAYVALKNIFSLSPEYVAAKNSQADMVTELNNTATAAEKAEMATASGGDAYKTIAVVGRDAFLAIGDSAAQADDMVKALLNTSNPAAFAAAQTALAAALKSAGDIATGFDAITTAAAAVHGAVPAAVQAAIDKLLTMKGLTDDERTALKSLADGSSTDFATLTSTASSYGITLQQLGPKFEQADLTGKAQKIYTDFNDLIGAGADYNGVLAGMAPTMSSLVQEAISFGGTVPQQFQPWIQQLIDSGQLLDANGNQITDITQIKFADTPLDSGLDKLTTALNNLTNILGGLPANADAAAKGIGDALGNVDVPTITIPYKYSDESQPSGNGGYGSGGGLVTDSGVQYLGSGGTVGKILPFRPRGIDTVPAMLATGEGVVSRNGMAGLGADGLAAINRGQGRGGATVVDFAPLAAAFKAEISALRRDLSTTLTSGMETAARHGAQTAGRGR